MTVRLTPADLEGLADAADRLLPSPNGFIAAGLRQAASDAATLDALWREIAAMDPNPALVCCFCGLDCAVDATSHAADCLYVRA